MGFSVKRSQVWWKWGFHIFKDPFAPPVYVLYIPGWRFTYWKWEAK